METQPQFHAEAIACGLHDRIVGGLVAFPGRSWRAVYLDSGAAVLREGEEEFRLRAPCLAWMPWAARMKLRVLAGSVGSTLLLGETPLANALGHKPEAALMRMFSERRLVLDLAQRTDTRADVAHCFDLIQREGAGGAAGSETVIEAQARVLVVFLWRGVDPADLGAGAARAPSWLLQSFRQLLEAHFRDRWTVARYAAELGISPDRLHDVCRRSLGKPPRQLIQERQAYEARVLLERSSWTIDQIAAALGFRDTPQFSKVFKVGVGVPPGAYRRSVRESRGAEASTAARSYADWP